MIAVGDYSMVIVLFYRLCLLLIRLAPPVYYMTVSASHPAEFHQTGEDSWKPGSGYGFPDEKKIL